MCDIPVPILCGMLYVCNKKRYRSTYMRRLNTGRHKRCESLLIEEMRLFDEESHVQYFRMTRKVFDCLLSKVGPLIIHSNTHRYPISPKQRLAVTLRVLSTGDSLQTVGFSFRMGKTTVCKIINETCHAICAILQEQYMPSPTTQMWENIAKGFFHTWNFPNCLGAVDGKHVVLRCPLLSGSQYYNYKGSHSIILLASVDFDYNFTVVDIGSCGRDSDGGVFSASNFGRLIETNGIQIPTPRPIRDTQQVTPFVFVADDAFPLKPNLMKPYARCNLSYEKRIFNYRLSRARRIVENAFGILAARWRIFYRPILMQPSTAKQIVHACVLLHNFLRHSDAKTAPTYRYITPELVDFENDEGILVEGSWRINNQFINGLRHANQLGGHNFGCNAAQIRDNLRDYFVSDIGSIPWQDTVIQRGSRPTSLIDN